jgi:hypothetical protein
VAAIDPIGGSYLMDRWRLSLRAPEEGDKTTKKNTRNYLAVQIIMCTFAVDFQNAVLI